MPRINNTDYRNRRAALQADWENGGPLLAHLTGEQQDALRAFYLFDVPLRSTNFASARHEAIKRDANLIGRAGLAYRTFARLSAPRRTPGQPSHRSAPSLPSATARQSTTPRRRITVLSELNRDVEPAQIARIFIAMAQEQLLRERAQDEYESR